MDGRRFDAFVQRLAVRGSRRAALKGGAALAATGLLSTRLTSAQEATPAATPVLPADPHPSADSAVTRREYLFVQSFAGGSWAPKAGAEGVYTLTLTGAAAQTTYFSDRPERDTGLAPTQTFLDGLGFTPENPPNAAIVAQTDTSEEEVLVVELFNPVYDAEAATLTYEAKVLGDYGGRGLAHLAQQQTDYELPASFGEGSLFIDDCPDSIESCFEYVENSDGSCTYEDLGNITSGNCWNVDAFTCNPCGSYVSTCYSTFASVCNAGITNCSDDIELCGAPACCAAKGGCSC